MNVQSEKRTERERGGHASFVKLTLAHATFRDEKDGALWELEDAGMQVLVLAFRREVGFVETVER